MKDIQQIKDSEIERYREKCLSVYEKLDMVYFKIVADRGEYYVKTAKGRRLSDVDVIINTVYRDISRFAGCFDVSGALDAFGEFAVGFFYLPVKKPNSITYSEIDEGTFILSDYHVENKDSRDDDLMASFVSKDFKFVVGKDGNMGPFLGKVRLGEWFNKYDDPYTMVHCVFNEMGTDETFSGNPVDGIEGIVLRDGKLAFGVLLNDTRSEMEISSKLIYRDTFLKNFIHTVYPEICDRVIDPRKDYVSNVCALFVEYIDSTDFFNVMWFEEDDFLPPSGGYVGDVSYEMLPPIISVICKRNPVYKNILRILLITFNDESCLKKFDRFEGEVRTKMSELYKKLHK